MKTTVQLPGQLAVNLRISNSDANKGRIYAVTSYGQFNGWASRSEVDAAPEHFRVLAQSMATSVGREHFYDETREPYQSNGNAPQSTQVQASFAPVAPQNDSAYAPGFTTSRKETELTKSFFNQKFHELAEFFEKIGDRFVVFESRMDRLEGAFQTFKEENAVVQGLLRGKLTCIETMLINEFGEVDFEGPEYDEEAEFTDEGEEIMTQRDRSPFLDEEAEEEKPKPKKKRDASKILKAAEKVAKIPKAKKQKAEVKNKPVDLTVKAL